MKAHNFRAPWRRVGGWVVDAEGNAVAARYSWRRFESDERGTITPCDADANCQALSAVPDLVEACEAIIAAFDDETRSDGSGRSSVDVAFAVHNALPAVRAALAKASGKKEQS